MTSPLRRTTTLVLLGALAAGCGRPADLAVGMKRYPTDLAVSDPTTTTAAPAPGRPSVSPGFPSPVPFPTAGPLDAAIVRQASQPPPTLPPSVSAEACPQADPFVPPARDAPDKVSAPPAAGTYQFRNDGGFTAKSKPPRSGRYPSLVSRTVGNASSSGSTFAFDVGIATGNITTTTSYLIVPESSVPGAGTPVPQAGKVDVAVPGQAGLYVQRIVTRYPDGRSDVLDPSPDLLLLPLPVTAGVVFQASGVDQARQIRIQYRGRVGRSRPEGGVDPRLRVDACGTVLDSWLVDITAGRLEGNGMSLDFAGRYGIGTQYGAISLDDLVTYEGTVDGVATTSSNRATINREPAVNR